MELNALDLVRQRTAQAHAALERKMFVDRIMHGTLQPDQLAQLLRVNHHFLEAVERNATRFAALSPFVIPRAHLAVEDLHRLDAQPLSTSDLMDHWGEERMRGALYVALGSLLGGAMITARLRAIPSLPRDLRFYAEDRAALAIWKRFVEELRTLRSTDAHAELVQGALETFDLAEKACALPAPQRAPVA